MRGLLALVVIAMSYALMGCSNTSDTAGSGGGTGTGGLAQPANPYATPSITASSPAVVFPSDFLTITGTNFGAAQVDSSRVFFSSDGVNTNIDAGAVTLVTDWTNTQIRIKVPNDAVSGPVKVTLRSRTASEASSNIVRVTIQRAFDPNAAPRLVFINPDKGQFTGRDVPITIVFNRPILLATITGNPTAAISLSEVNAVNPNPAPPTDNQPAEDPCARPQVCDLRVIDPISCNCPRISNRGQPNQTGAVTAIVDISGSLQATPQTAFQVVHNTFAGSATCIVGINPTIMSDGRFLPDGTTRTVPGANIPSLGETRFFFPR